MYSETRFIGWMMQKTLLTGNYRTISHFIIPPAGSSKHQLQKFRNKNLFMKYFLQIQNICMLLPCATQCTRIWTYWNYHDLTTFHTKM